MLRAYAPFFLFNAGITTPALAGMGVLEIADALDYWQETQRRAHGK